MLIGGLQKTSLLDFPGRVACVVFTVGCNWRCPFCQNPDLIDSGRFEKSGRKLVSEAEFLAFLDKRKKILEGVVISGGEPTLQPDLVEFCQKIKDKGLAVKVDTNGSRPEVLKRLFKEKAVDYVAMDFKNSWQAYDQAAGVKVEAEKIKESIILIRDSGVDYEFRTTLAPGVHDEEGVKQMAKELGDLAAGSVCYWQKFRPGNCLDERFNQRSGWPEGELGWWKRRISGRKVKIRLRYEIIR